MQALDKRSRSKFVEEKGNDDDFRVHIIWELLFLVTCENLTRVYVSFMWEE